MYHKQLPQYHLDEINRFRIINGLKPIIRKKTRCLMCRRNFESQDYPRQRMCERCRLNDDGIYLSFSKSIEQDFILAVNDT